MSLLLNIVNMIPKIQSQNQRFENIIEIFHYLPDFPHETEVYGHIKDLIRYNPKLIKIDVIAGIHQPVADQFHFNIRVYHKSGNKYNLLYDNLHVYVVSIVMPNESGNPVLTWYLDPTYQITQI